MGHGRGRDRRKGRGERYQGLDVEPPTESLVSKGGEGAARSVPRKKQERPQGVHALALCHLDRPHQEAIPRRPSGRNVHPDLALCQKVGEEVPRRRKAEEQLEESERRGAPPQGSAFPQVAAGTYLEPGTSVSWVERGRCGGGSVGLHRRG